MSPQKGSFAGPWHRILTRWEDFSLTENTEVTEVLSALIHSWKVFSLTELTDLTELFGARFRAHRTPPAYRVHRALLPKVAVTFCEICRLNVSVKLCVFCSSVFFCEKKKTLESRGEVFLSQSAQSSLSIFGARFEPTERLRHTEFTEAFQLRLAVTLCDIG